ncbi:MAG: 2-keto-4-pentenoate hydratase [Stellaceae bacterium]
MTASDKIQTAARALREARASAVAIPPISSSYGITSIDDAHAAASINTARVEKGVRISGRKIGLTSCAVQRQLGVDEPDFGVLFADTEYLSGATLPTECLIQPRVEGEIALIVGRDGMPKAVPSWGEFLNSLSYALPALEIVDSAVADWRITVSDTVADNGSAALYVMGDQPLQITTLLADVTMRLRVNGVTVSEGLGSACLDHPLRAAFWLARTMAARGEPLRGGEIILSGALGPMTPVKRDDAVEADFGTVGRVACRFG